MMETDVIFQGSLMPLRALEAGWQAERLRGGVDGPLLSALAHDVAALGDAPPPPDSDAEQHHVPRTLSHASVLRREVLRLRHAPDHHLVLRGFSREELELELERKQQERRGVASLGSEFLADKITSLDRDSCWTVISGEYESSESKMMEQFRTACIRKPGRNVHLVQNANGTLLWHATEGSSDAISKFVVPWSEDCNEPFTATCKHEMSAMESAVECSQRVCLLLGEPGIGKTSFLCSLAERQREMAPEAWAVVVKLLDHLDVLADLQNRKEMDRSCVASLLAAAAGVGTPGSTAARRCLEGALFHTGAVHVYVDGVDEVMPTYREVTLRLLELLVKETKAARVWVAARPEVDASLRGILSCSPISLLPLSSVEQLAYLRSKWTLADQGQSPDASERVAEEILSAFASAPGSPENSPLLTEVERPTLLGVPLNLQMMVEAFAEDMKMAIDTSSTFVPTRVSQLELFQRFIEKRRERYKNRYRSRRSEVTYGAKAEDDVFLPLHLNYAMLIWTSATVPLEQKQFQDSVEKYKEYMTSEKTGIFWQLEDGRIQFAHYTIVEYLVAIWLFENHEKSCDFKQLFQAAYINPHSRVMVFLDLMLAEGLQVYKAIIENDTEALALIRVEDQHGKLQDLGGRTTLHVAAAYGRSAFVDKLLEAGCDSSRRDSLLGWTALKYASATEKLVTAETLLGQGANPDDLDISRNILPVFQFDLVEVLQVFLQRTSDLELSGEMRLVHVAAERGSTRVMRLLLEKGQDINVKDAFGNTPLHEAAKAGHRDMVDLLSRESDIHCRGWNERTPLHFACAEGHVEVARLLMSRGADVFQKGNHNIMPIHNAASNGHKEIIPLFAESQKFGLLINSTAEQGKTSLHLAVVNGRKDVVEFLLENDADIWAKTVDGNLPVHLAALYGQAQTLEVLLRRGADIHCRGWQERTPLHDACERGHEEVVQLLLSKGADIFQGDINNRKPIHIAAFYGHKALVELFLKSSTLNAKLLINSRDKHKNTPLHMAARNAQKGVVEFLVENDANIRAKTAEGNMPIHIAAVRGHEETTEVLLRAGTDIHCQGQKGYTSLHFASAGGHEKIVQLLLSKGAGVSNRAHLNDTPLRVAAEHGHKGVVELLLGSGAVVECRDLFDRTPLYAAASNGHVLVVQLLLTKGADTNRFAGDGSTPLHGASWFGHSRVVVVLLHAGALVNARRIDGKSALHLAATQGHRDIVELLLSRGADAHQMDREGHVPIQYAISRRHVALIEILLRESFRIARS